MRVEDAKRRVIKVMKAVPFGLVQSARVWKLAHCEEFACEKVKSKMNFVEESERAGIWTLQGMILRENLTSLALCKKCGFREVGYRERISQMNGVWRDVILMERRSKVVGINKEFKEAEL